MRLCLPYGAPGAPGSVNTSMSAAQGVFTWAGSAANLTQTTAGSFVMPTAANTGDLSGVTRTAYTGTTSITGTTNLTITNKNITQSLTKAGSGTLTIRNCRLSFGGGYAAIDGDANTGAIIVEDCDIIGTGALGSNGIAGSNLQVRRCNISQYENGLNAQDGPHQIISNFIHALGPVGGAGTAHVDGIQIFPDSSTSGNGMLVQGNAIYSWDTSCILYQSLNTNINTNALFDNNWFLREPGRGGGSYCVYIEDKNGHFNHGSQWTNNWFDPNYGVGFVSWGDTGGTGNVSVWSNNRTYPAGANIPLSSL